MKNIICVTLLSACLWNSGRCTISGWTKPLIEQANGEGTLVEFINEGVTTGEPTGITITATSGNVPSLSITYAKVSHDPAAPELAIDGSSGVVTVTSGTVAYSETSTSLELIVTADDTAGNGTATVTININAGPVIAPHDGTVCIADGAREGVELINLDATDANTGQAIEWAIVAGGNTNTDFAISTSGIVQVNTAKTLNMTATASYTLTITAADNSNIPLTATTTVTASLQTACSPQRNGSAAVASWAALSLTAVITALVSYRNGQ